MALEGLVLESSPTGNSFIDITFEPEMQENAPRPEKGKSHTVSIGAIYEGAESGVAKENEVWTGRVLSKSKTYNMRR